jgi:D-glycero-alpha-D-manno-heptose-7-phosphate kinase|tara:strand:+ start:3722 stop:4732 length:1011 start_codon:yes stop_codon:yes gene_type:complete
MILGRSPLRISFSGGGTDLEEYHSRFDGYAISYTINKYTFVIAKLRQDNKLQGFSPDFSSYLPPKKHRNTKPLQGQEIVLAGLKELKFSRGVDIYLSTDVEPNSGLGASSALTTNFVNVITHLNGKKWNQNKIAMKAYKIGHDILKWGIGKQDEFASAYGGFNIFKFTKDRVTVNPISLNRSTQTELENNSLLFRLGNRKHSAGILNAQIRAINKSKPDTIEALHSAKDLALKMRDVLKQNDLVSFYKIINDGWKVKKQFTKGVSNTMIDNVSKVAFSSGASALKVTGAGGGGHMYVYAEPKKHNSIKKALKRIGVSNVDFKFQSSGATVFDVNNL